MQVFPNGKQSSMAGSRLFLPPPQSKMATNKSSRKCHVTAPLTIDLLLDEVKSITPPKALTLTLTLEGLKALTLGLLTL